MPQQDTSQLKAKIISTIRMRGPCLPVHIARETGLSILFAGAFLSELVSDKTLKISSMKVGGTPVYYMPGQEPSLDKFSEHLKSKERDAYSLLKEKKFLVDREQEPAIRVALREIKDFAAPFRKDDEIIWRYHTIPESDFAIDKKSSVKEPEKIETKPQESMVPIATRLKIQQDEMKTKGPEKEDLNIFDKEAEKEKSTKKEPKKKTSSSKDDKFFNKIKDHLNEKNIEIMDILDFSKSQIVLKVNQGSEKIIICFNKKRIAETDILKAHKISQDYELPYSILSLGEPTKKFSTLIEAIKDLEELEKV